MKIGFIGLGNMGQPMVANLAKAGHQVSVWNRTRSVAEAVVAPNVTVASTAPECAHADVLVTMLADDRAVQAALVDSGLLAAMPPSTLHVEMATISVALSRRIEALHAVRGGPYIAAPVFGRADVAAAAKLFVLAAGATADIDRARPIFDAIGQRTFVVGDKPYMANLVKISGNFLVAAVIESMSEAIALARKAGLDPKEYLDVITSTIFPVPAYKVYGAMIAEQRYTPALFKLPLGLKDVNLAFEAGSDLNVPLPTASLLRDHFLAALARGHADKDWAAIGAVVAEAAGL